MRIPPVAVSLALVAILSGADASVPADTPDESFKTIDLTAIGGSIYFIKCKTGTDEVADLPRCGIPTLWEQTNGLNGLQTKEYPIGRILEPDTPLLA